MSDDAKVIPFPVATEPEPEPEDDDWTFADAEALVMSWESGDEDEDDEETVDVDDVDEDPTSITEAGGRWVWQEAGSPPVHEPPVGMVAHRISTMCRWTYLHLMRDEPIPSPCCYSVLVTTKRLPGPVRTERNWLAMDEEGPTA